MKNYKRIVLSTLTAAALISAAAPAARAVEISKAEIVTALGNIGNFTNCRSWLWELICNSDLRPDAPETEKPEVNVPDADIPETDAPEADKPNTDIPDTEAPEATPDEDNGLSASVHAYERAVVELVNEHRASYGLSPLTLSEDLCVKARIKSKDMADNNYFSHNSPTYGSPFDMMKALGISYRSAAENIAMGQTTPAAVVTAWMNSQGHRENILSEKYTTIGVGYVADGNYWTQWFIG